MYPQEGETIQLLGNVGKVNHRVSDLPVNESQLSAADEK
jgi:hypothetical protein